MVFACLLTVIKTMTFLFPVFTENIRSQNLRGYHGYCRIGQNVARQENHQR
jgi:hypothetical protein